MNSKMSWSNWQHPRTDSLNTLLWLIYLEKIKYLLLQETMYFIFARRPILLATWFLFQRLTLLLLQVNLLYKPWDTYLNRCENDRWMKMTIHVYITCIEIQICSFLLVRCCTHIAQDWLLIFKRVYWCYDWFCCYHKQLFW